MSQPVPTPTSTGDREKDRIARGAPVVLQTKRTIPGPKEGVQTSGDSISITFDGSADLKEQLGQVGANEAHLTCRIPHTPGWPDAVLVFLNTPNATATTPTAGGFVGALGLFDHPDHATHGMANYRLPLTAALAAAAAPSGSPNTITFVPYTFRSGATPTPTATSSPSQGGSTTGSPVPSPTDTPSTSTSKGQTGTAVIIANLELVLSQVGNPNGGNS